MVCCAGWGVAWRGEWEEEWRKEARIQLVEVGQCAVGQRRRIHWQVSDEVTCVEFEISIAVVRFQPISHWTDCTGLRDGRHREWKKCLGSRQHSCTRWHCALWRDLTSRRGNPGLSYTMERITSLGYEASSAFRRSERACSPHYWSELSYLNGCLQFATQWDVLSCFL